MSDQARDIRAGLIDRRVVRTLLSLRMAFNRLILSRGYDGFTAVDVAEQANVGRSTLYKHYNSKEDILAKNVEPALHPLADICVRGGENQIALITQHFWENRKLATALMSGRARGILLKVLSGQIKNRLDAQVRAGGTLPASLIAAQIANAQLGLIEAWLTGRHRSSTTDIATALQVSSSAMVKALTTASQRDSSRKREQRAAD